MKTCEIPDSRTLENRGMAWMIGAFVFCPCHLPITLAALAFLLGGTAAGVALRAHPYVAAAIVTAVWAAGTWRGYLLIRAARRNPPRKAGGYLEVDRSTGSMRSTGVGLPSRSSMTR